MNGVWRMYPDLIHEEVIYQNPFLCMRIWQVENPELSEDEASSRKLFVNRKNNDPCGWHYHKEVEFLLIHQGELSVQLSEEVLELRAGDVAMFGSKEPHATRQTSTESLRYIVLQFDLHKHLDQSTITNMKHFSEVIRPLSKLNYIFREKEAARRQIFQLISEIHEEMMQKITGYELAVSAKMKHILLILLRNDDQKQLHYHDDPLLDRIVPALEYIDRHLTDKIKIEDMTRLVNMSYYYFVKIFKKALGMSFTDYVNFKRIKRAEQLLLTEDLSIMEVADQVGIANLGHFYEMFKRINNCSPKQFKYKLKDSMNGGELG